ASIQERDEHEKHPTFPTRRSSDLLKWLLGGPGIVFLYAREELARRLAPQIAGWFGHKNQFAFDPRALELHEDARRFELGTPSLADRKSTRLNSSHVAISYADFRHK